MSIVKSFAVGEGDMYYIKHDTDNFTTIDCCLNYDDESRAAKTHVLDEILLASHLKNVHRFISTHPDEDHISGLKDYVDKFGMLNFYCVKNDTTKKGEESEDFKTYKQLRDNPKILFELSKGCRRKWMNDSDTERGDSGLNCLWPITSNEKYKAGLEEAKNGGSPNNISPAIKYQHNGFSFLWLGDMETDMQEEFDAKVTNSHVTIVFAPHHGRKSGHIPASLLNKLCPRIIVVGEADSCDLDYYKGHNTITQNTAGDILFEVGDECIDIYVSNQSYNKTDGMTTNWRHSSVDGMKYLGSIAKNNA